MGTTRAWSPCWEAAADHGQVDQERHGRLPIPPKSACWFCPFHSLREWREMRRTRPELFDRAAALEAEINERRRSLSLLRDPVYLTRRLKPLPMAVEDDGQDRLFDGCESGFCWT